MAPPRTRTDLMQRRGALVLRFAWCVLPFHDSIRKAMPLCHLAMGVLSGEHADHHDGARRPLPARATQEPVKRIATDLPRSFQLAGVTSVVRVTVPKDANAYRSFISLGALRCDQDVGLHLLACTLLI